MKKITLALLFICCSATFAQQVKNVILLIPDGCSLATISSARWYQWYNQGGEEFLNIDPYLCGTVRTTCSNAPIGDSAPTTSTYMTGYNSRAGWVSTYPLVDPENDIYPMDKSKEYQPITTLLEAARLKYGKSIGLVCTCEFPHATPADCSSHSYNREKYEWIMPQQAHNGINVLIGGGAGILPPSCETYLKDKGYGVFKNDINAMRTYDGDNMWALYGYKAMSYDIDRNPEQQPSLAEMTKIAIQKLSKNNNGFVLMVEGSKVDWAAHNNDAISMITDFLAFDKACKEAFDFAKLDGNTAVIVVPDHGNSGISIGRGDWGGYATTPKSKMFGALSNYKASCEEVANRLNHARFEDVQKIFKELCGFELTEQEMNALKNNKEYDKSPIAKDDRRPSPRYNGTFSRMVAQFMTARTGIAFTTNGHTGEDVFLAAYHPQQALRPYGMLTNIQLNEYLCNMIGADHSLLDSLTTQNFVDHHKLLQEGQYQISQTQVDGMDVATLIINAPASNKALKGRQLVMQANSNIVEIRQAKGKNSTLIATEELPTVTVYVDKTNTFYISRNITDYLYK